MVKLQQMKGGMFFLTLPKIEAQKAGWQKGDNLRVVFNDISKIMIIEKLER